MALWFWVPGFHFASQLCREERAFSRPRVLEDRVPGEVGQGRGGPFCPEAAGREISALLASPPSPVQQNIWSGLSRGTWCCVKIISTS